MAYAINYNDERFQNVEAEKQQAINENDQLYNEMIGQSDKYYQDQIDASKEYADTQSKLQQEQTDFAIEQIEQQKEKAEKDYTKEQSGAYVDWQKESNKYGANAEAMAAQGLANTGYSESSQVSMYNTYQNRVATARESYQNAVLNYNNAIKDARLQNNSILAEIAYNALQQQLELSLQGFQYKNQLILDKAATKREIDNTYYSRYQDVLAQINHENALNEEVRQFNANYSLQQQELGLRAQQLAEQIRQFDEEMARLKANDAKSYELELKQLAQAKELAEAELAEEKRQFNSTMSYNSWKARQSSSGSSGSSSKSSGSSTSKITKSGSGSSTITKGNASAADITNALNKATSTAKNTLNSALSFFGLNSSGSSTPNVSTYEQAASYLRKIGATKGDGGLMTKSEWASRKSRGSSAAEAQYSTYAEYLNNFIAWKMKNPDK